jgi:hypothetical protein
VQRRGDAEAREGEVLCSFGGALHFVTSEGGSEQPLIGEQNLSPQSAQFNAAQTAQQGTSAISLSRGQDNIRNKKGLER